MTEIPTIAENWQEDEQTYTRLRAVREATARCPCDRCDGQAVCRTTGHECAGFKRWCKTGTTPISGNV